MHTHIRSLALVAALATLSLSADAATLKLKNGTSVSGKVTRYDADSKTLYLRTDAGKDASYRIDELDARSSYLVNASLVPANDAKAQLMVANFARDAGLYAHAARRYGIALKLEPGMKSAVDGEMTKLRRTAAEACMKNARAAVAKNDLPEAERWLTALVEKLPDEPEAQEASALLDRHYTQVRGAKMDAANKKASEGLQKDIEKGRKRYADMLDKSKKGLQARASGQATGLFQSALRDGEAVLDQIEEIEKSTDDPRVRESTASYRDVVVDQMVDVHLHMASQLTVRSDYQGAQRAVNEALSLDPKNERALAARARIEEAASSGWGRPWL